MKLRRKRSLGWFYGAVLLAGALLLPASLWSAESFLPAKALGEAQGVANVRVTKAVDELREEGVLRFVTFSVVGKCHGLEERTEVVVPLPTHEHREEQEAAFAVGRRWVVLLLNQKGRWEVIGWLAVTDENHLAEPSVGQELGLKAGLEADAAVELLAARLRKDEPAGTNRPKAAPSARNQPWNLMRASPLRRVWPFFPH